MRRSATDLDMSKQDLTPTLRHHEDPFDRMLVAQAMAESLTVVTHDRRFAAYGVPVLWT